MDNQIYCLTVEGGPLNDPIRNLLFDAAQEMIDEGLTSRIIRTSVGEGEISTDNEQACLGGISGTVFHADLDTDRGSFEVVYIVRPSRHVRAGDGHWNTVGW